VVLATKERHQHDSVCQTYDMMRHFLRSRLNLLNVEEGEILAVFYGLEDEADHESGRIRFCAGVTKRMLDEKSILDRSGFFTYTSKKSEPSPRNLFFLLRRWQMVWSGGNLYGYNANTYSWPWICIGGTMVDLNFFFGRALSWFEFPVLFRPCRSRWQRLCRLRLAGGRTSTTNRPSRLSGRSMRHEIRPRNRIAPSAHHRSV
jgi:hypothetical protein